LGNVSDNLIQRFMPRLLRRYGYILPFVFKFQSDVQMLRGPTSRLVIIVFYYLRQGCDVFVVVCLFVC